MRCISDVKGGVRSGFCLRLFPEQFIPSDIFAGKRIADIEEQDCLRILNGDFAVAIDIDCLYDAY